MKLIKLVHPHLIYHMDKKVKQVIVFHLGMKKLDRECFKSTQKSPSLIKCRFGYKLYRINKPDYLIWIKHHKITSRVGLQQGIPGLSLQNAHARSLQSGQSEQISLPTGTDLLSKSTQQVLLLSSWVAKCNVWTTMSHFITNRKKRSPMYRQ